MAANENLTTLLKALDAIEKHDLDTAAEGVAEDVAYTIRGHSSVSGVYTGREALAEILGRILSLTSETMTAIPEVVLAEGDTIMMYVRVFGSRPDGRIYGSHQAYLYRFRDGRLIEGQTVPVDQRAFDEFFAD